MAVKMASFSTAGLACAGKARGVRVPVMGVEVPDVAPSPGVNDPWASPLPPGTASVVAAPAPVCLSSLFEFCYVMIGINWWLSADLYSSRMWTCHYFELTRIRGSELVSSGL